MIRPPKAIDYPARPLDCEEALEYAVRNIADQAVIVGWGHEEIAAAIMEIASAWFLTQLGNAQSEEAIDLARSLTAREKK